MRLTEDQLAYLAIAAEGGAIEAGRAWLRLTAADRVGLLDRDQAKEIADALRCGLDVALRDLLWDAEHATDPRRRVKAGEMASAIVTHVLRLERARRVTGREQVGWAFDTAHDPAPHERGSLLYSRVREVWFVRVGEWVEEVAP